MAEKKERRYSVDFEHFENAMLTEAAIGHEIFNVRRWSMSKERRAKIVGMLKRFAAELKPEIDARKEQVRAYQGGPTEGQAIPMQGEAGSHPFPNGD